MDLTEQELAGLSETERAALEDEGGYEESRLSGDDDAGIESEAASASEVEGEGAQPESPSEESPTPGASEAQNEAEASAEQEPEEKFRPRYVADLPADFQQQAEAIENGLAEIEKKYRDAEIDFDEFRKQERSLIAQREALSSQRLKAEIATEQSAQAANQEWQWNVKRFMRETTRTEGIDYTKDAKANKALDSFVKALAADPDNAQRDSEWFLQEAHRRTKVLLGIGKAPAAAPAATAAQGKSAGREKAAAPRAALADMPQAGSEASDTGGDEFAHLDKLSGMRLERELAKLSPEKVQAYLEGR